MRALPALFAAYLGAADAYVLSPPPRTLDRPLRSPRPLAPALSAAPLVPRRAAPPAMLFGRAPPQDPVALLSSRLSAVKRWARCICR